ncbi:TraK family protein [Azospirillum griseum]|uniref:Uncharacterized protein n=1 Tax=Azospirillum griseum TaxID=2496639 RepID=A0A431V9I6_9PROT|nr:TraK family protein [Azospirillum griseum]RTR11324.1 hypothetical protein EJ903_26120 [Azospirillum griseum]
MTSASNETLSQLIIRRIISDPNASSRDRTVAILQLYRAEIEAALTDGCSVLALWRVMTADGRITSTYQSFRKCVNRFILGKQPPARRRN